MERADAGSFTVATYNVNSIRSRLHIVIPWLLANRPAVLCMQETKVKNEAFPVASFTEIGYKVFFSGSGGYNGVAVACTSMPLEVSSGFIGTAAESDRIMVVRFPEVTVVNLYVPQGREKGSPHFDYKIAWFSRFGEMLGSHFSPDYPLIVCGDVNVAPEDIDVHSPRRLLGHVCFTPEVWEAYAAWKEWGLQDVFRRFHAGEGGQFSFFDYRVVNSVGKGLGWRIDHILATAPVYQQANACWIDLEPRLQDKPSDHTPVVANFAL